MDSYMMALTREIHRLLKDGVAQEAARQYAPSIVLYDRLVSIESKLDKIIETLPRYDEIADLESMTIPGIEGLEDKDANA